MNLMTNESGLKPLGCAILVEYYEPERKSSMIVIPASVLDRTNSLEQRARIVEVGENAWPNEPPRAAIGDYVLISKMSGAAVVGPKDGKPYRMINDRDVFAQITYVEETA